MKETVREEVEDEGDEGTETGSGWKVKSGLGSGATGPKDVEKSGETTDSGNEIREGVLNSLKGTEEEERKLA